MATTKKHLSDLHFEHTLWKLRLAFYSDELKIYTDRLEDIASKNTALELKQKVGHFASQFLIQDNEQVKLRQEIDKHDFVLMESAKKNPIASEHRLFEDHDAIREKMKTHDHIFENLKKEFLRFCEEAL